MSRELCITIPCELAKGPDLTLRTPIMVFIGVDKTGADRTRYECPLCHGRGPRYKPIAQHMGLRADKPATCKVLLAEDKVRRSSREVQENQY